VISEDVLLPGLKFKVMGILLFFIAYILFLPLSFINFLFVKDKKGYFRSSALSLDKFANREFRTLWNRTLITKNGYQFGNELQSISEVLGRNIQLGTLSIQGKILVKILTQKHCIDAINN